jgi:hypothetical protein
MEQYSKLYIQHRCQPELFKKYDYKTISRAINNAFRILKSEAYHDVFMKSIENALKEGKTYTEILKFQYNDPSTIFCNISIFDLMDKTFLYSLVKTKIFGGYRFFKSKKSTPQEYIYFIAWDDTYYYDKNHIDNISQFVNYTTQTLNQQSIESPLTISDLSAYDESNRECGMDDDEELQKITVDLTI